MRKWRTADPIVGAYFKPMTRNVDNRAVFAGVPDGVDEEDVEVVGVRFTVEFADGVKVYPRGVQNAEVVGRYHQQRPDYCEFVGDVPDEYVTRFEVVDAG